MYVHMKSGGRRPKASGTKRMSHPTNNAIKTAEVICQGRLERSVRMYIASRVVSRRKKKDDVPSPFPRHDHVGCEEGRALSLFRGTGLHHSL